MKQIDEIITRVRNFVFLGEAGSGKSEVAVNLAFYLLQKGTLPVHFFDLDMTKPLFRSRDLCQEMEEAGICFHYEEQFYDAPTMVGGVQKLLKEDCYTILDVGGDHIGARSLGAYAPLLKQEDCRVYYVLNAYRPWNRDITTIDTTLGLILGVSHLEVQKLHLIDNSHLGPDTTLEENLSGYRKNEEAVSPYLPLDFGCVREELAEAVQEASGREPFSLKLRLNYPWNISESGKGEEKCPK